MKPLREEGSSTELQLTGKFLILRDETLGWKTEKRRGPPTNDPGWALSGLLVFSARGDNCLPHPLSLRQLPCRLLLVPGKCSCLGSGVCPFQAGARGSVLLSFIAAIRLGRWGQKSYRWEVSLLTNPPPAGTLTEPETDTSSSPRNQFCLHETMRGWDCVLLSSSLASPDCRFPFTTTGIGPADTRDLGNKHKPTVPC